MRRDFEWAFTCLMHLEGGFVNHANDPGGATNFGISLRYLIARGDLDGDGLLDGDVDGDGDIDIDDIRGLTEEAAKGLYFTGFWLPNLLPRVSSSLINTKVFDMAVNMGSRQAWRLVQRAANEFRGHSITVDGLVGIRTLDALNLLNRLDYELLVAIRRLQRDFYDRLVNRNPELRVFHLGWMRRAAF